MEGVKRYKRAKKRIENSGYDFHLGKIIKRGGL